MREIAQEHLARGDALGWFDVVYAEAQGDPARVPWADLAPNPSLLKWLDRGDVRGDGARALVVGCGLGDDAVALAGRGFSVTAFDISPKAIEWARRRFSALAGVEWRVADLLALPVEWARAFDFVLEAYTLPSLGDDALRTRAMRAIASTVRVGGTLLVVSRRRDLAERPQGPPWPLAREELGAFDDAGLVRVTLEEFVDRETPPQRRLCASYRRGR